MSQADEPHTPSSSGAEAALAAVAGIVFRMEDALNEGLCLSDALINLVEGRREGLRVKPDTMWFMAYEVKTRLERVHADWRTLFAFTHSTQDKDPASRGSSPRSAPASRPAASA